MQQIANPNKKTDEIGREIEKPNDVCQTVISSGNLFIKVAIAIKRLIETVN